MSRSKEDAIKVVVNCAQKYKQELEKRNLLFICTDKEMNVITHEVCFFGYNFMHLTGLKIIRNIDKPNNVSNKTQINDIVNATSFYEKCLERKLSPNDFTFSADGTTGLKLDVLPFIIKKNLSASMIGEYNSNKPKLYTEKLAGGVKACVGFTIDNISHHYVPNTLLKEDIRKNVYNWVRVIATFRKNIIDEKYKELTFVVKDINWNEIKLPKEYEYLSDLLRSNTYIST